MKSSANSNSCSGLSSNVTRRTFIAATSAAGIAAMANVDAAEQTLPPVLLPYLQHPMPDTMTACLPAQKVTEAKVVYTEAGQNEESTVTANAIQIPGSPWTIWKARMKKLQPGKRYQYVIHYNSEGKNFATQPATFRVFDPDATETRCAVFNDIHNKIPTLQAVLSHVDKKDFDFSILNGDMENDPKNADNVLWVWNEYVRLLDGATKPLIFVRGNHEYRGRFRDKLACLFDLPHLNLADNPDDYRYESEWTAGPIHFVATDTGEDDRKSTPKDNYRRPELMQTIRQRQAGWLQGIASKEKQSKHRVFVSHIPLYNTAPWWSQPSREQWIDSLQELKIDLAVAGHDHSWKFIPANQTYVERQPKSDSASEVTPVFPTLIGGGPALKQGSVILIHATQQNLTSKMYNAAGKLLHSFTT